MTIGELTPDRAQVASAESPEGLGGPLGIEVQPLEPALARQLGLPDGASGVVVTAVDPSGPNADRLAPGDVIQEAAGHPIETPRDLASAMREARGKGVMLMKVLRQGNPVYVGAEVASS